MKSLHYKWTETLLRERGKKNIYQKSNRPWTKKKDNPTTGRDIHRNTHLAFKNWLDKIKIHQLITHKMSTPSSSAVRALALEYKSLQEEPVEGFRVKLLNDDNLFEWEVAIFGPPDTLYQGGYFKVSNNFQLSFVHNFFLLTSYFRSRISFGTIPLDLNSEQVIFPKKKRQQKNKRACL